MYHIFALKLSGNQHDSIITKRFKDIVEFNQTNIGYKQIWQWGPHDNPVDVIGHFSRGLFRYRFFKQYLNSNLILLEEYVLTYT